MRDRNSKSSMVQLAVVILAVIFVVTVITLLPKGADSNKGLEEFARCLSEKGAVMYGAYWCSHCQNEKKNFGKAFRFINYVECTKDPKKCAEAGVEGFPTWVFPDRRRLEGEQGLEKLSAESGCLIEEEGNQGEN